MKILHGISIFSKHPGEVMHIYDKVGPNFTALATIELGTDQSGKPGIPAIDLGEYPIHGEVYVDCPAHTDYELFYTDVN